LTQVLFDPTRRDFFDPKGKKLKIFTFLGEIFQTQTKTIDSRPDPGQKFLIPSHGSDLQVGGMKMKNKGKTKNWENFVW